MANHWNEQETNSLGRAWKTFVIPGHEGGSWSQHCCTNIHSWFVRAGCIGRDGRSPPIIANIASEGRLSLNGIVPVNTCCIKCQQAKYRWAVAIHDTLQS